jgi:hypothetical protein
LAVSGVFSLTANWEVGIPCLTANLQGIFLVLELMKTENQGWVLFLGDDGFLRTGD